MSFFLFLLSFSNFFYFFFFFFNDTATTEIYTLSLHDALPISSAPPTCFNVSVVQGFPLNYRSEEHTSELQSRPHLVCRLLLEKKKNNNIINFHNNNKKENITQNNDQN